jgi:hypothetical protein
MILIIAIKYCNLLMKLCIIQSEKKRYHYAENFFTIVRKDHAIDWTL